MKLLVVESPSKAKTISKYLDKKFRVLASVGHIKDLPKSNKKAVDIKNDFEPHYEIVKGKEKVVDTLRHECKKADEVILATDPDREGEAIAWHVAETCGLENPKRIVFHEITEEAIRDALEHPRDIDINLKKAQEARRVLDRLVGYDLSGLIWKKLRYGLSAGRVQSPALRIIMEREREVRAFIKEKFWVITAEVSNKKKEKFIVTCSEEPKTQKRAEEILEIGKKSTWIVSDISETEVLQNPKPPFITSTLQQAANSRLSYSPSRTMFLAQKLYEAGHITYMRTDSTTISQGALLGIKKQIEKEFGGSFYEQRFYKTKSKSAQEAHEAIRPTHIEKKGAGATPEQKKLYDLIRMRTLASQMKSARVMRTKITAQVGDGKKVSDFYANGSRILFPGWLSADFYARKEDTALPETQKNEPLSLHEINSLEKETQPPKRYSEAGLIRELEKREIGRPSTYASIIKTLVDREYVKKEGRTLIPTDTGEVVNDFLEAHFAEYISDSFTKEMEEELDEIAEGKREYAKTLKEFYKPFSQKVAEKEDLPKITTLGDAPREFKCPTCGKHMIIKLGKGGKFLSCEAFPECTGARTIDGKELRGNSDIPPIGKDPKSGENIYLFNGRFGPYVQLGEKTKENPKPRRGGVPPGKDTETLSVKEALTLLSLPRTLGVHPETKKEIVANKGRFGPYIVHDGDFRSLKNDDVYTIELPRALEILSEEKKIRRRKPAV
jgi:DNA topoisomerase-1